jgi:hypothetical protein
VKGCGSPIRFVQSLACAGACLALLGPVSLLASEPQEIAPGRWVRVTTGTEVAGEGFAMSLRETQDTVLSHDKRTMTFDVSGQPISVAKPDTTLEGAVQILDDKTLVLKGAGEKRPIVVPRDAIIRVDLRQRRSSRGRGAAIGAGAGLAVGLLGGLLSGDDTSNGCLFVCFTAGEKAAIFSIIAVPIGALLGVVVAPGAKWQRDVHLERAHVNLGPTRGRGIALSVSVRF